MGHAICFTQCIILFVFAKSNAEVYINLADVWTPAFLENGVISIGNNLNWLESAEKDTKFWNTYAIHLNVDSIDSIEELIEHICSNRFGKIMAEVTIPNVSLLSFVKSTNAMSPYFWDACGHNSTNITFLFNEKDLSNYLTPDNIFSALQISVGISMDYGELILNDSIIQTIRSKQPHLNQLLLKVSILEKYFVDYYTFANYMDELLENIMEIGIGKDDLHLTIGTELDNKIGDIGESVFTMYESMMARFLYFWGNRTNTHTVFMSNLLNNVRRPNDWAAYLFENVSLTHQKAVHVRKFIIPHKPTLKSYFKNFSKSFSQSECSAFNEILLDFTQHTLDSILKEDIVKLIKPLCGRSVSIHLKLGAKDAPNIKKLIKKLHATKRNPLFVGAVVFSSNYFLCEQKSIKLPAVIHLLKDKLKSENISFGIKTCNSINEDLTVAMKTVLNISDIVYITEAFPDGNIGIESISEQLNSLRIAIREKFNIGLPKGIVLEIPSQSYFTSCFRYKLNILNTWARIHGFKLVFEAKSAHTFIDPKETNCVGMPRRLPGRPVSFRNMDAAVTLEISPKIQENMETALELISSKFSKVEIVLSKEASATLLLKNIKSFKQTAFLVNIGTNAVDELVQLGKEQNVLGVHLEANSISNVIIEKLGHLRNVLPQTSCGVVLDYNESLMNISSNIFIMLHYVVIHVDITKHFVNYQEDFAREQDTSKYLRKNLGKHENVTISVLNGRTQQSTESFGDPDNPSKFDHDSFNSKKISAAKPRNSKSRKEFKTYEFDDRTCSRRIYQIFKNLLEQRNNWRKGKSNFSVFLRISFPTYTTENSMKAFMRFWDFANDFSREHDFPIIVYKAFDEGNDNIQLATNNSNFSKGWWIGTEQLTLVEKQEVFWKKLQNNIRNRKNEVKTNVVPELPNNTSNEADAFKPSTDSITLTLLIGVFLLILVAVAIALQRYYKCLWSGKTKSEIKGTEQPISLVGPLQESDKCSNKADETMYEMTKNEFIKGESELIGLGRYGLEYKAFIQRFGHQVLVTYPRGKQNIASVRQEIKIRALIGDHSNIARLVGAYTKQMEQGILYMATEYLPLGSLLEYLSTNVEISINEMYRFCKDISCGLAHIYSKQIYHGNIRSENILLGNNYSCKIGDFSSSRMLYSELSNDVEEIHYDKLPWRWMPVEMLKKESISSKSDIWALGVTFWEIFSKGLVPYSEMNECETEFISKLERGFRLPNLDNMSDPVYLQLCNCWKIEPENRPNAFQLEQFFLSQLNELSSDYAVL